MQQQQKQPQYEKYSEYVGSKFNELDYEDKMETDHSELKKYAEIYKNEEVVDIFRVTTGSEKELDDQLHAELKKSQELKQNLIDMLEVIMICQFILTLLKTYDKVSTQRKSTKYSQKVPLAIKI